MYKRQGLEKDWISFRRVHRRWLSPVRYTDPSQQQKPAAEVRAQSVSYTHLTLGNDAGICGAAKLVLAD